MKRDSLEAAAEAINKRFGTLYGLVNAAGGNSPRATASPTMSYFDIPEDALRFVLDLNILGTMMPCQILAKQMVEAGEGVILNYSSMNAYRPLTNIAAYSASKAAITNFTAWLATYLAQNFSGKIRVNAIAPGFFLGEQNRFLVQDKDTGGWTARGQKIVDHTPMGRFGNPEDLLGCRALAALAGRLIRHGHHRAGGWRVLGVRRGVTGLASKGLILRRAQDDWHFRRRSII